MFGRLTQDFGTAREGAKELIVEIVAVGDDDDGGVFHGGMQDQPPCVKRHAETLARALRVPDDADAVVAAFAAFHRLRFVYAFQFFDRRAALAVVMHGWFLRARN